VAQSVTARRLLDAGLANREPDGALQCALVEVMPPFHVRARIDAAPACRKDVLPGPLPPGRSILARERVGQIDFAETGGEVLLVQQAHRLQMALERHDQLIGQSHDAILAALAVAHKDRAVIEVEILDAQSHSLHQPQARTVHQTGRQPVRTVEDVQQPRHLVGRQNRGQPLRPFRANHALQIAKRPLEHGLVEKAQRIQGLVLRARRDAQLDRKMGKKGSDLALAHIRRMAPAVETDEPNDPGNVGLLRTNAIVTHANRRANVLEKRRARLRV